MAKRYIGDAVVTITYHDSGNYRGTIQVGKHTWKFDDLHAPAMGFRFAYDSPEAYDTMAESAVSFATYYSSDNRGEDTPDWAPSPAVADAISEATNWAQNDQGKYEVRRSAKGKTVSEAGSRLNTFTRSYIETALWSTNDESNESGGEPLDKNYGPDDISPETMAEMVADCASFQTENADALETYGDDSKAGHYFWLARNGHGAGFTDDDYKVVPELSAAMKHLQKAAHDYGEVNLDVGDDGQIYGMGEARRRPVTRQGRNAVRDYIAVDSKGRFVGGPFRNYDSAKRSADEAGGHVEFKMNEVAATRRHPNDVMIFTLNGAWKHERVPAHVGMIVRINLGVEPNGQARSGADDYVITRVDTTHGQEGRVAVKLAHGGGQETWGDPRGYLAVGADSHGVARGRGPRRA